MSRVMKVVVGIVLAMAVYVGFRVVSYVVTRAMRPIRPRYTIVVANRTHHTLEDVWVYYGVKIAAAPGHIVPGGRKTYAIVTLPMPEEATVTWVEESVKHAPKVNPLGTVPLCPIDLHVWFIINDDASVEVAVVRDGDRDAHIALSKTLLPYREQQ